MNAYDGDAAEKIADVRHPDHYKSQAVEPIEYMMMCMSPDEFRGFLRGNALKYLSRADKKNGKDDYAKALVYVRWLDEYCRTGRITPLRE
jgi:hypothetical protein